MEHSANFFGVLQQWFYFARISESEIGGQEQLRFNFCDRAKCNAAESDHFRLSVSGVAFGDIGRY